MKAPDRGPSSFRVGTWNLAAQSVPVTSPHPAAAVAVLDRLLVCSCVLPWRGAGVHWPGDGDTAARTRAALDAVAPVLADHDGPLVWGGDWNHALAGPESAGSLAGRGAIADLTRRLDLRIPTSGLPHRLGGHQRTIGHVAVPAALPIRLAHRIPAPGLGDHDAYVVALDVRTRGSNEPWRHVQVNVGPDRGRGAHEDRRVEPGVGAAGAS